MKTYSLNALSLCWVVDRADMSVSWACRKEPAGSRHLHVCLRGHCLAFLKQLYKFLGPLKCRCSPQNFLLLTLGAASELTPCPSPTHKALFSNLLSCFSSLLATLLLSLVCFHLRHLSPMFCIFLRTCHLYRKTLLSALLSIAPPTLSTLIPLFPCHGPDFIFLHNPQLLTLCHAFFLWVCIHESAFQD